MSIEVKLIEEEPKPKPKFNIGDVVKHINSGVIFDIVKVERMTHGDENFIYWGELGQCFSEKYLILHEEEKKPLTFGNVPFGGAFVDKYGNLCVKIQSAYACNAVVIKDDITFTANIGDGEFITRILDGIEIREVRK